MIKAVVTHEAIVASMTPDVRLTFLISAPSTVSSMPDLLIMPANPMALKINTVVFVTDMTPPRLLRLVTSSDTSASNPVTMRERWPNCSASVATPTAG